MALTKIPSELSSTTGIVDNSNATAITIDSNENVGIGTTSPNSKLDTGGDYYSGTATTVAQLTNKISTYSTVSQGSLYGFGQDSYGLHMTAGQAGQSLMFHTGGSAERVRIDGSGRVTMPYQPAFSAYLILNPNQNGYSSSGTFSASSSGIGSTAGMPLVLKHTKMNRGGHYSTSTGRFTAPVAGAYQFHFSALPDFSQAAAQVHVEFYINGAGTDAHEMYGPNLSASQPHVSQVSGSTIFQLSAGDYVSMQFQGGFHQRYVIFCGHLIG